MGVGWGRGIDVRGGKGRDGGCVLRLYKRGVGLSAIGFTNAIGLSSSSSNGVTVPTISSKGTNYSMSYSLTSNPASIFAYKGAIASYTPVSGPSSTLSTLSSVGSWGMNSNGTATDPFLNDCFYATFDSDGFLHEKLNPNRLSRRIAEWSDEEGGWITATGQSSITSENTMFCYPTIYRNTSSSEVNWSTSSDFGGTAYGGTIDGHTYQYCAVGVYEGIVKDSKLMSISGVTSTGSTTRPNLRTYAAANSVKNGKAMLWNLHQNIDYKTITSTMMRNTNSQATVGMGGCNYSSGTQGLCDAMGPWAGCTGTSSNVKALIENAWGSKWEYLDDVIVVDNVVYAGQNSGSNITDTTSNKTNIGTRTSTSGNFITGILTDSKNWGIPSAASSGSSSTYFTDGTYTSTGTKLVGVGGSSGTVSSGGAGLFSFYSNRDVDYSDAYGGSRLSFVFDL